MLYKNLKTFLKKIPILWKLLCFFKDILIIIGRLKDVIAMMVLFHFWPQQTYRFSTRKLLPGFKNKYSKNQKPLMPYNYLKFKTSDIPKLDEINIVGMGSSFNLNNIKKLKGPVFLISFWNPLKIDNNGSIIHTYEPEDFRSEKKNKKNMKNLKDYKNNNITYLIGRKEQVDPFIKNGSKFMFLEVHTKDINGKLYPLNSYWDTKEYLNLFFNSKYKRMSIEQNIYKGPMSPPYTDWTPTGSFIPSVYALLNTAKKVNIYGWDFYLENPSSEFSYWQLLLSTYKYHHDVKRSKSHFECALLNFYYAYLLSKMPNVKIHSNLRQLDKHKKIINKIERVLYN